MPTVRNKFRFLTDFNDQTPEETTEFVIPEDVATLSDADLGELHSQAVENFQAVYGDGSNLSDEDVDVLSALTDGIEGLNAELETRKQLAAERAEKAAELASRVQPADDEDATEEDADEEGGDVEEDEEDEDVVEDEEAVETVVAASKPRREVRVNVSRKNSRFVPAINDTPKTMKDVVHVSDGTGGFATGQGVDWDGVAKLIDHRLKSYPAGQLAAAARSGKTMRQQLSLVTITKPSDPDMTIKNNDPQHMVEVINRAVSEKRLEGGSLVAAGGWCAPSETLYDLVELESTDGLYDLPEVGIARGGIKRTLGPDFSEIFEADIGWSITEEDDIEGDYDGEGGDKPCYRIECPEFDEFRLGVDGLCLQAGLLQARGYPEMIARVTRGALVAHEHKMAARRLLAVEAGSTAVSMPTPQAGVLAPLLSAIELHVEHTRTIHRLPRAATVEVVFPFWVRGMIRADLSRRVGVNAFSVTDGQIAAWFRERGAIAQFVYNWSDLTGAADTVTAWPTEVKFLMYPAGTWIAGTADILTMDAIYDSTLLAKNDFTALFTEEGWMVVKMSHDSRVITVPLCADGTASAGVLFDCDGNILADAGTDGTETD